MRKLVRPLVLFLIMGLSALSSAARNEVRIGVNGLTCSQCTRNVEMSLRKLPFIADVQMNLEHTDGDISLKPGADFNPAGIAKAVRDAGFSIRFLQLTIPVAPDTTSRCFRYRDDAYQLVTTAAGTMGQPTGTIQYIGEDFLPRQEWKKWKPLLIKQCRLSGKAFYFVTFVNNAA